MPILRLLGRALWFNFGLWSGPFQIAGLSPFYALVFLLIPGDTTVLRFALPMPGPFMPLEATLSQVLTVSIFVVMLFAILALNYHRDTSRLQKALSEFAIPRLRIVFDPEQPRYRRIAINGDVEEERRYSIGLQTTGATVHDVSVKLVRAKETGGPWERSDPITLVHDNSGQSASQTETFDVNPGLGELVHVVKKNSREPGADIQVMGAWGNLKPRDYVFELDVSGRDVGGVNVEGPQRFRVWTGAGRLHFAPFTD